MQILPPSNSPALSPALSPSVLSARSRPSEKRTRGFSGLQVLGIVFVAVLITALGALWVARTYLWPADFEPVQLTAQEEVTLDSKLRALGIDPPMLTGRASAATREDLPGVASRGSDAKSLSDRKADRGADESDETWLRPEAYQERAADREIGLSERELNALIGRDSELSKRFAIDLSKDLASARLLVPIDPDFPLMGGRTLRIAAGLELAYRNERPVVALRGLSLMGVPIPNAWLGQLKNVDLVDQFGTSPGFWRGFADGVEFMQVRQGELRIKLRE